jgi:hypothetical protein
MLMSLIANKRLVVNAHDAAFLLLLNSSSVQHARAAASQSLSVTLSACPPASMAAETRWDCC